MIRLVLAFMVPIGIATAAALLVGSNTVSLPGGEPMLVAGHERMAALHAVDHSGCPPKLLTGAEPVIEPRPATIRIVKLADQAGDVSVTDLPIDAPDGTNLLVVIDKGGRLVAAGDRPHSPQASGAECPRAAQPEDKPGII